MVSRSSALWNRGTLRVRPRLRANAHVHHRLAKPSGCHPVRSHARQRRVLALCHSERSRLPGRSFMRRLEESLAVCFVPSSALRLADPRKLEFRTAQFLQDEMVTGDLQLINRYGEWRFDFDSVLGAKAVPAAHVPHKHSAI